jgi:hypothetical protein
VTTEPLDGPLEAMSPDDANEASPESTANEAAPKQRSRSDVVIEILKVAAMVVMAVALVIIATAEVRQTRVDERGDCLLRASAFREDVGTFPRDFNKRVEQACGGTDPLGRD